MSLIYEPSGKAREYSPLALNIYRGCDHGCAYCYINKFGADNKHPVVRAGIVPQLENELRRQAITKQVLVCFMTDPYCNKETELMVTQSVLDLLANFDVPVAVLTKAGKRCLRDTKIFKRFTHFKIGATLTFTNEKRSLKIEPGAATPSDRMETLKILHDDFGFRTWVSLEPVIDPSQSLEIIDLTHEFVDEYQVGKINNYPAFDNKINWREFGRQAVEKLLGYGKDFYVKKDLREKMDMNLDSKHTDIDYLTVGNKSQPQKTEQAKLF